MPWRTGMPGCRRPAGRAELDTTSHCPVHCPQVYSPNKTTGAEPGWDGGDGDGFENIKVLPHRVRSKGGLPSGWGSQANLTRDNPVLATIGPRKVDGEPPTDAEVLRHNAAELGLIRRLLAELQTQQPQHTHTHYETHYHGGGPVTGFSPGVAIPDSRVGEAGRIPLTMPIKSITPLESPAGVSARPWEDRFGPSIDDLLTEFEHVRLGERGDPEHVAKTLVEVKRAARKLGWVTPTDADTNTIRLYLAGLTGRDGGLASVSWRNNVRTYLSSFFSYCVEAHKIDANPVAAIPCLKQPKKESKVGAAMESQVRRLCEATRSRKGGRDAADWYWHFFCTGVRPEGSQQLRKSDYQIDCQHPHLSVPAEADKERNGYRVEIVCPELVQILKARLAGLPPTGLVWPNVPDSSQFIADWEAAGFKRTADDGKKITRYSIRHGTATAMANDGVPMELAARQMGHSGASMTRYYVDGAQLNVRAALMAGHEKISQNLKANNPQTDEGTCTTGRLEVESSGPNGELPMSPRQGQVGRVSERPSRPTSEVQILRGSAEGQTGTLPPPSHNFSLRPPTDLSGHSLQGEGRRGGCDPDPQGAGVALLFRLMESHERIVALAERVLGGAQ
jgi:integrase